MTQRKVVIVPVLRATKFSPMQDSPVVTITNDEIELLMTYLRDPKAYLENNESVTMTVSMESLLSAPHANHVFGREYCGFSLPATAQDVIDSLLQPELAVVVQNFIYNLLDEHAGGDTHGTVYKVEQANVEFVAIKYLKNYEQVNTLLKQAVVQDVGNDFPFQDGELVTWSALLDDYCSKTKECYGTTPSTRQQWRKLFIEASPVGMFRRSPTNPVSEFTPGVRHSILLELAVNPGLVKEVFLAAFRELAIEVNDPSLQFPDFLRRVSSHYGFPLPGGENNKPAINWENIDHVAQLTGLLTAVFMFDELQERNYQQQKRDWRWDIAGVSMQAVRTLSGEEKKFYIQYSRNPHSAWQNREELKYNSPEEADNAACRYEQILTELDNAKFVIYDL